jgi:NADH-quinone oxidoreductase subunit I
MDYCNWWFDSVKLGAYIMNDNDNLKFDIAKFFACWSLAEIRSGLSLTLLQLFASSVTLKFPQEITPRSRRYRGALALRRYSNGEERCIACKLCEATCPALAITIESEECSKTKARRTTRFDIDAFKCVHCGLCEEACPVDSIVLTKEMHYHFDKRGDNILTKDKLLAIGDLFEKDLAQDRFDEEDYR